LQQRRFVGHGKKEKTVAWFWVVFCLSLFRLKSEQTNQHGGFAYFAAQMRDFSGKGSPPNSDASVAWAAQQLLHAKRRGFNWQEPFPKILSMLHDEDAFLAERYICLYAFVLKQGLTILTLSAAVFLLQWLPMPAPMLWQARPLLWQLLCLSLCVAVVCASAFYHRRVPSSWFWQRGQLSAVGKRWWSLMFLDLSGSSEINELKDIERQRMTAMRRGNDNRQAIWYQLAAFQAKKTQQQNRALAAHMQLAAAVELCLLGLPSLVVMLAACWPTLRELSQHW